MSSQQSVRVLLVDDQQDIHDMILVLLKDVESIRLVGQAYNGHDALHLCQSTEPDLILLDVVMPAMDGVETARQIKATCPACKILVISNYDEYDYIKALLDSGAVGYIVKTALVEDLIPTILAAMQGNTVLSPMVMRQLLDPPKDSVPRLNLTGREAEVLTLMCSGSSDRQIAAELNISPATVRFHFKNMLHKLQVETRSELLVLAAKGGLV